LKLTFFSVGLVGGFAHVYIARIEGKSGYVVLKRVAVPDGERLKMVEKEIAFMASILK
jgi:AP2-associated kinase